MLSRQSTSPSPIIRKHVCTNSNSDATASNSSGWLSRSAVRELCTLPENSTRSPHLSPPPSMKCPTKT
eukprot:1939290-Pyramimonas_sp.AAC.1